MGGSKHSSIGKEHQEAGVQFPQVTESCLWEFRLPEERGEKEPARIKVL